MMGQPEHQVSQGLKVRQEQPERKVPLDPSDQQALKV
jgi:hypothetical protein